MRASSAHPGARLLLERRLRVDVAHGTLDVAVRLERLAVLVLLSLLHVVRHGERPRERKWSRRAAAAASGSKFRSRNFVERPVGGAENAIVVPSRGPSLTVWRARAMSPAARSLARRRASSLLASTRHSRAACGAPPPRVSPDPSEPCTSSAPSFCTSAPRRVSSPRDANALGVARVCSRESRPRDGAHGDDRTHSGVLLRDFLSKALYDKKDGYFARPDVPVGVIEQPIAFASLLGADDYANALDVRYRRLAKQWLTPVEIFKPHYAEAVARYVLHRYREEDEKQGYPLRVYEIGGGAGTHAAGFLRYLRRNAPEVFAKTEFTSVEISQSLARAAERTVRDALDGDDHRVNDSEGFQNPTKRRGKGTRKGTKRDSDVYSVIRGDASERDAWGAKDASPCFVVALEVLDNLPHDKVIFRKDSERGGHGDHHGWFQTRVRLDPETNKHVEDHSEPLSDALAVRAMETLADAARAETVETSFARRVARVVEAIFAPALASKKIAYLPTGCLKLLETLHGARPNHRLVAADFDSLPGVTMAGRNAPLVAAQADGGRTNDLPTYLAEVGSADVFFPTDFDALRALDAAARRTVSMNDGVERSEKSARGEVLSTRAFMERWADVQATATRSGYNPLLQDFANTKFFLS